MLKKSLLEESILKYPDHKYMLLTDASKCVWACVLTQLYEHNVDVERTTIQHPITLQSGSFRGCQMNWADITKEAHIIYKSVMKWSYYLDDVDIILKSDPLSLQKFLDKNTLNTKANKWAVEIWPLEIKYE